MFVLALTGAIGAGKSTAAKHFEQKGAARFDLDRIAKEMLLPNSPVYWDLLAEFGPGVCDSVGRIEFAALAEAGFKDEESAKKLNAIVHPVVARRVIETLDLLATSPDPPAVAIMDVPLLVDVPQLRDRADLVLSIEANEDLRLQRLVRRGMSAGEAVRRDKLQATVEEREDIADVVIRNEGDQDSYIRALDEFWERWVEPNVA